MARETTRAARTGVEERVIGDYTYRVTRLGARAGLAMSVQLAKLLAPSAANGIEGLTGSRSDGFGSIAVGLGECLRELAARVTAAELAQMHEVLAKHTVVVIDAEREPQLHAIYDDHFAGHYDWLTQWFTFALEANFRSFFAGTAGASDLLELVERIAGLMERFAPPSPSQPPSSGTSTGSPRVDATATA